MQTSNVLNLFVHLCFSYSICFVCSDSRDSCINITERFQWKAMSPRLVNKLQVTQPKYIVVHHSALEECFTRQSCAANVREIQQLDMVTNNWGDIGYNFLIGGDGSVFEGRGWGIKGAHAVKYNSRSIGICLLGNFMVSKPSGSQLAALSGLIECGVKGGHIDSSYRIIGHRQANPTLCPGDFLFAEIRRWSRFNVEPRK